MEMKVDGLREYFMRIEIKLDRIIVKQNLNPRLKSLNLFQKIKSKVEQILDESAEEIIWITKEKNQLGSEN